MAETDDRIPIREIQTMALLETKPWTHNQGRLIMIRKILAIAGLLVVLSQGAIAATPSLANAEKTAETIEDSRKPHRASGRNKVAVSQCRLPGDVDSNEPRCILTSLPEAIDVERAPKPRRMPSCVTTGDCIVTPGVKAEHEDPPMDDYIGVPTGRGSTGTRVKSKKKFFTPPSDNPAPRRAASGSSRSLGGK